MKELNRGFARLREYPIGSVCTIKRTGPNYQHFLGRDVTIIEGLLLRDTGREEYGIEVQGE